MEYGTTLASISEKDKDRFLKFLETLVAKNINNNSEYDRVAKTFRDVSFKKGVDFDKIVLEAADYMKDSLPGFPATKWGDKEFSPKKGFDIFYQYAPLKIKTILKEGGQPMLNIYSEKFAKKEVITSVKAANLPETVKAASMSGIANDLEDLVGYTLSKDDEQIEINSVKYEKDTDELLIRCHYTKGDADPKKTNLYGISSLSNKLDKGWKFDEYHDRLMGIVRISENELEALEAERDEAEENDEYGNEKAIILVIDGYDDELKIRKDYSGRGMYGKECFGIVVGGNTKELEEDFEKLGVKPNKDSMGLDVILYWPQFTYENIIAADAGFGKRYKAESSLSSEVIAVKYDRLSEKAKLKARKDYRKGWSETHPNDHILEEDLIVIMDNDEDEYHEDGGLISDYAESTIAGKMKDLLMDIEEAFRNVDAEDLLNLCTELNINPMGQPYDLGALDRDELISLLADQHLLRGSKDKSDINKVIKDLRIGFDLDIKAIATAESNNKQYGFFGTTKSNFDLGDSKVEVIWNFMVSKLQGIIPNASEVECENFLDATWGRHLADELTYHTKEKENVRAVKLAITAWAKDPKSKWVIKAFNELLKESTASVPEWHDENGAIYYGTAEQVEKATESESAPLIPFIADGVGYNPGSEYPDYELSNFELLEEDFENFSEEELQLESMKQALEESYDANAYNDESEEEEEEDSAEAAKYGDVKGQEPADKDIQRMKDLEVKAKGDEAKMLKLAQNMANTLGVSPDSVDKAIRRAKAAEIVYPGPIGKKIAKIFMDIAVEQKSAAEKAPDIEHFFVNDKKVTKEIHDLGKLLKKYEESGRIYHVYPKKEMISFSGKRPISYQEAAKYLKEMFASTAGRFKNLSEKEAFFKSKSPTNLNWSELKEINHSLWMELKEIAEELFAFDRLSYEEWLAVSGSTDLTEAVKQTTADTYAVFVAIGKTNEARKQVEEAIKEMLPEDVVFEENLLSVEDTDAGIQFTYPAKFLDMLMFNSEKYPDIKYQAHTIANEESEDSYMESLDKDHQHYGLDAKEIHEMSMNGTINEVNDAEKVESALDAKEQKRYDAIKKIVDDSQYAKIEGVIVDGTTANLLLKVCDALSEENRKKLLAMPIKKMVDVAWKLTSAKAETEKMYLEKSGSVTMFASEAQIFSSKEKAESHSNNLNSTGWRTYVETVRSTIYVIVVESMKAKAAITESINSSGPKHTFEFILSVAGDSDEDNKEDNGGDFEYEAEELIKEEIKKACKKLKIPASKCKNVAFSLIKELGYEDGNYHYKYKISYPRGKEYIGFEKEMNSL